MSVNTITGRSAFLALLKDEGITHLFGNPGTTELPIMDALTEHPDLNYMMSMQESLVVYMACLLYTSPSPRDRQKSRMPSSA